VRVAAMAGTGGAAAPLPTITDYGNVRRKAASSALKRSGFSMFG
jgi:hypothetical protein